MMNDMTPTIEESIDPRDAAQHEHEQWQRRCDQADRWADVEAQHGPLMTRVEWLRHSVDMNAWFDQGTMK
tara:strand:+ start:172 stop:381 length:210 start_codon:yes stop_codon:yes gene_type:complete